jgi:hypothetical protein
MTPPQSNLDVLLRTLRPVLNPGVVCFCRFPRGVEPWESPFLGVFRETEGLTVIVPEHQAVQLGWSIVFRAAWITLSVHSDLQAVGLTAAVAGALAAAGISCNVVAAVHHDHLFVPADMGDAAIAVLLRLQAESA